MPAHEHRESLRDDVTVHVDAQGAARTLGPAGQRGFEIRDSADRMLCCRPGSQGEMLRRIIRAGVPVIASALTAVALAQPSAVPYPHDYKASLVKYAVVDRADGFSRDLYVSRSAINALQRDSSPPEFPLGTLFAIDVHRAKLRSHDPKTRSPVYATDRHGRLLRSADEPVLHLMQKTQVGLGSRNWTFAGYDPSTAQPLNLELPGDCLLCHQAALTNDMAFSVSLLKRFVATGAVQHRFCSYPGRQICSF
jgi:hypothetical protein